MRARRSRTKHRFYERAPASQVPSVCAWCGQAIPDGTPVVGFGAKARPDADLRKVEGSVIPLKLVAADKTVPAIVATSDSEAKKHGYDLMFMTCSDECAAALQAALRQDGIAGAANLAC